MVKIFTPYTKMDVIRLDEEAVLKTVGVYKTFQSASLCASVQKEVTLFTVWCDGL